VDSSFARFSRVVATYVAHHSVNARERTKGPIIDRCTEEIKRRARRSVWISFISISHVSLRQIKCGDFCVNNIATMAN